MTYLAEPLVIKHIVFVISNQDEKEAVAIEGLVKQLSQFQNLYRIRFGHHESSPLSDVASMSSFIQTTFNKMIDDLQKNIPRPCLKDTSVDALENIGDNLSPLFCVTKSISAQNSFCDLSIDDMKFFLSQSLIEVIMGKEYRTDDWKLMWNSCRQDCWEYPIEAKNIQKVAGEYKPEKAIRCYTLSTALFRLINRAFRLGDIERIFRFGCYIADLYQHLKQLGSEQRLNSKHNTKKVFQGKRCSTDVLQQLKDSIGHPICINGLLSTSKNYDIAKIYSGFDANNDDGQSIIFEINIDCTITNPIRPYANISEISAHPDEDELLFFIGFVWKLESMEKKPSRPWYIILQPCTNYDSELSKYIEESKQKCTYLTIGNILQKLGDYANADNFYRQMLKNSMLSDETRGHVYFYMALLAEEQGQYLEAQEHFKRAEELIKTTKPHSDEIFSAPRNLLAPGIIPSRINILNNLGRIHLKEGEYKLAEETFEAALQEPGSDVQYATVLNNYGLLKYQTENVEQARDYFSRSVQLARNDTCCSEFNRNLEIILKHISSANGETDP